MIYRLPTDEEWSTAVGLKNEVGTKPEEKSGKIERYLWDIKTKDASAAFDLRDAHSIEALKINAFLYSGHELKK